MLSFISIPRSFSDRVGVLQENAVRSWTRLDAGCEVILFGDDPGVDAAAARLGVRHEPHLARTSQGTPILQDLFARADAIASHPILCFVNSDIILFDDLIAATQKVATRYRSFMMVSSRYDLQVDDALTFGLHWDRDLRARACEQGRCYPAAGSDIFVFRRGLIGSAPPLAIGRGYWDNWLMLRARERGAELIDVTRAVVAVHQDHDYAHFAEGKPDAANEASVLESAEGQSNLELAGGHGRIYTVYDATVVLTEDGRFLSTLLPRLFGRRIKAWLRRAVATVSPDLWAWYRRYAAR